MEMNAPSLGKAQVAMQIRNRQQAHISKFDIPSAGLSIGRGWGCDVILTDSAADAEHALLSSDGNGGWTLADLGSTNGTSLNGTKLSPG